MQSNSNVNRRCCTQGLCTLIALIVVSLTATPASAQGVNAAWNALGPDGGLSAEVILHPADPTQLFVYGGAEDQFLYYSENRGASWEPISEAGFIRFFLIEPVAPYRLFLGMGNEILVSADAGEPWRPFAVDLTSMAYIAEMYAAPTAPGRFYARSMRQAYRSNDDGASWEPIGSDDFSISELIVSPLDADLLFAPAGNRLLRSEDGGRNWRVLETGLTSAQAIDSLTVDPTNPSVWYAGASVSYRQHALYRSDDAGVSWRPINDDIRAQTVEYFAYSADQALLYALTESRLFWRSTEAEGWNQVESPPAYTYSSRLAVDPAQNERLFLLTDGRLFRAESRSEPWQEIWPSPATQPIEEFVVVPTTPTTLVATTGMSRVWVSRDNGESWQQTLDQQGENASWPCSPTTSFAYDPANSSTLYFFRDGGLFRSRNGGGSWQKITSFSPNLADHPFSWCAAPLAVEAESGAVWLGAGQEIWRSGDEGATWQAIPTARFDDVRAVSLASARPGTAAVLDADRILITQNDGVSWLALAKDGSSAYPLQVELGPDSMATLTVSFSDRGLFTRTVDIEAFYLPLLRRD